MRIMTAIAVLCTASTCFAAIVPTGYSATPGTATFIGPLANGGRTYQLLINANQLTSLVGQDLLGLSWRLPTSATAAWPTVDVTFSNYDIYLSGSVAPADRSLTFADNVVGMQTQVRSGSLSIPTGAFPFGDTPNSAGPMITFNTAYTYTGGHLLVEIRHTGHNSTSRNNDAIGTSITGYGTDFSAAWTGSYTGTSGSQGNFSVVQFAAIPEPITLALLGPAGLVLLWRRRPTRLPA